MNHTYTPLIIEGKIYVVVDAPEIKPKTSHFPYNEYGKSAFAIANNKYNTALAACTKYETLEQDAPYWEERIGQRVEVEIKEMEFGGSITGTVNGNTTTTKHFRNYAIPPQQKQGDEWDEADRVAREYAYANSISQTGWYESYLTYLRNNYSITKK